MPDHFIGETPAWGPECVQELESTLLSQTSPFPCTFAVSGVKRNSLRFGFVESLDDESTWGSLTDVLTDYLKQYRDLGRETSLVVFFRQKGGTRPLAGYRKRFWAVLQHLHEQDPSPWPAKIPRDTDDAWWEFSFGGTPIFVVCNTPAHGLRRSRHSPVFFITFQPRWVFEGLDADTPAGAAARRTIRKRLSRYDTVEASPQLGSYGDPRNREWLQYFLPDGPDAPDAGHEPPTRETRCPFRHRRTDGAAAQATGLDSVSRLTPKMVGDS